MLRVPADSVRPGVAGRRDIDTPCCRSCDGYYERSGKCRAVARTCGHKTASEAQCCAIITFHSAYRMAGNFGGNLFWRIAEISVFGGIYFGVLAKSLCHNDIHSKMANPDEQC